MIKTDAPTFGTIITAMVTPFDNDLKIDFKAVERIVEHLIQTGTTTLVVAGTTGESPTLEEQEKLDLLKAVIQTAKGRAKIIAGTGSNDTTKTIKLTKAAESLGADGALVVAPYYNKPSQDGLIAHFGAIAKATKLPIVVYNIPGRSGINITTETTLELAKQNKNIYALKDSTGSTDQAADIAGRAPDTFRIYSGDDYLTLPFLSIGACGVVSVASHIAGNAIKEMIEAFQSGDSESARQIHYQYLPLFKGLFAAPNPTCVKYALSTMGLCTPNLRLPLVPLAAPQQKVMDDLLANVKTLEAKAGKTQTKSQGSSGSAGQSVVNASEKAKVRA